MELEYLWAEDRLLSLAVRDASDLAEVAMLATIMPAYVAVGDDFQAAVWLRYRQLTRPGTANGPH